MEFNQFERRAREVFAAIPPQFREGVAGVQVHRGPEPHPSLPDVFTLGECRSDLYPSEFGGPGEVTSLVHLYHGSFARLAEMEKDWDWEYQLWETLTHEVQHHLEFLADEDGLETRDYVEDQNFARREAAAFDPLFYRDGERVGENAFLVDGDVFLEQTLSSRVAATGTTVAVEWDGRSEAVPLPDPLGDVHFLTLNDWDTRGGEVVLVLMREAGWWESLRAALTGRVPRVLQTSVDAH